MFPSKQSAESTQDGPEATLIRIPDERVVASGFLLLLGLSCSHSRDVFCYRSVRI